MLRASALLLIAAVGSACGGSPVAPSPAPDAPPTASPGQPTSPSGPVATLDPAQSDAGVVGEATLPNDTRGGRTGTHSIVGQASAASDCSTSFEGTEFTAVAWIDDAQDGQLARLSVTVPNADVPGADGRTEGIDGRVSFDFRSESGFGTLYTGDSSGDNEGSSSIDVERQGDRLSFTFTGVTWDEVEFSGRMACQLD
jgi:hypothetical protein